MANKKILIVGGSSGIGLAAAKAALHLNANVTIASHDREKLRQASDSLSTAVSLSYVDTGDNGSILKMFSETGSF